MELTPELIEEAEEQDIAWLLPSLAEAYDLKNGMNGKPPRDLRELIDEVIT